MEMTLQYGQSVTTKVWNSYHVYVFNCAAYFQYCHPDLKQGFAKLKQNHQLMKTSTFPRHHVLQNANTHEISNIRHIISQN